MRHCPCLQVSVEMPCLGLIWNHIPECEQWDSAWRTTSELCWFVLGVQQQRLHISLVKPVLKGKADVATTLQAQLCCPDEHIPKRSFAPVTLSHWMRLEWGPWCTSESSRGAESSSVISQKEQAIPWLVFSLFLGHGVSLWWQSMTVSWQNQQHFKGNQYTNRHWRAPLYSRQKHRFPTQKVTGVLIL